MSADKRAQILEGVMRVLGRDGLTGVTMRAVAAGIAVSASQGTSIQATLRQALPSATHRCTT